MQPPTMLEIEQSAERITGQLRVTPLLENSILNREVGGRVLVKAESLQITGSFKVRGVLNRLATLTDREKSIGIVCFSSGNHGHAVAWAASQIGCRAIIVVPADAPPVKVESIRDWGAEVVAYDRATQGREQIVGDLAMTHGLTIVPPFDDRRIIAGAGTLGRETAAQAAAMGVQADAIIVGCGGGGLAAGCGISWQALVPEAGLWIVEPQEFDDTSRSIQLGCRVRNVRASGTICDALLAPTPGELTFSINRRLARGAITVSDDEVLSAMRAAVRLFGLATEPGGVLPLAAVLSGRFDTRGREVVLVLSGSNVDPSLLSCALSRKV
ncbi:hypothetical protein CP49_37060 [Bradyrhizobium valentinum]|uniref:Tryptophan synthase beta chain-like PALP domain-containing protein n=2 Tax=Bradyrhizobium valentinum TaxID=1518501 RepID=A0A0R3KKT2_9BRAD|nr:hypothetical protein CP49_37060 [Bradyrhizobium valentinum]